MESNREKKAKRRVATLPEDLWTEILVRLPAKSLMRFRCVQRSWNALFRTRAFVTRHSQMQMQGSDAHLMIFHRDRDGNRNFRITLLCDDPSQPPRDVECPFADNSLVFCWSYGACNGIFCLHGYYKKSRSQLILWNPATREVKVVPAPPHHPSHDDYLRYSLLNTFRIVRGFGVDPGTNDFKVVNLVIDYKSRLQLSSVEVYNLSTNSWTVIHDDTLPATIITSLRRSKYNAFANGVYHWLTAYDGGVGDRRDIVCFDFRNNRFRKLKAPIAIRGLRGSDDIAEVNDSIAYIVNYYNPVRLEIWILNQDSWTKKYNIGPLDHMVFIRGIWKGGAEILAGKRKQPLVSYNSDARPVRQFQIIVNASLRIHKYVESMAPLSV